jgi:LysR family transcriptional regulator, regulator of peptidoglycan recycling
MRREELANLTAFLAVAEDGSFTRAAVRLGMTQSALSQVVRRLEEGLGVRLLTRTTRSVAPTEAGAQLLQTLAPAVKSLDASLAALRELRDKPTGTIRITSVEHATEAVLWPAIRAYLRTYPDVRVEIVSEYRLADLAAERYDAGVRLGEQVDKDMIAVRLTADFRQAIVASPRYLAKHTPPVVAQDLLRHQCINLHFSASRGHYVWELQKGKHPLKVRVEGAIAFSSISRMREAALDGFGLVNLPEDYVAAHLAKGRLVRVLEDWCPAHPGYHLYYPSRRQPPPAFALLVQALRYRG